MLPPGGSRLPGGAGAGVKVGGLDRWHVAQHGMGGAAELPRVCNPAVAANWGRTVRWRLQHRKHTQIARWQGMAGAICAQHTLFAPPLTGVDLAGGGAVQVEALAALLRAALGGGATLAALCTLLLQCGLDGRDNRLLEGACHGLCTATRSLGQARWRQTAAKQRQG